MSDYRRRPACPVEGCLATAGVACAERDPETGLYIACAEAHPERPTAPGRPKPKSKKPTVHGCVYVKPTLADGSRRIKCLSCGWRTSFTKAALDAAEGPIIRDEAGSHERHHGRVGGTVPVYPCVACESYGADLHTTTTARGTVCRRCAPLWSDVLAFERDGAEALPTPAFHDEPGPRAIKCACGVRYVPDEAIGEVTACPSCEATVAGAFASMAETREDVERLARLFDGGSTHSPHRGE